MLETGSTEGIAFIQITALVPGLNLSMFNLNVSRIILFILFLLTALPDDLGVRIQN